jgi:hypothetical protein
MGEVRGLRLLAALAAVCRVRIALDGEPPRVAGSATAA